jgi:AGZA family xanthine/uracil permease-like MFS transporter
MMMHATLEINWRYMGDAIPAFLTISVMPFTYSIADGLIAGIISYILINGGVWVIAKCTGGRIVPPNRDDEHEAWTWKIPGGFFPPWLVRAVHGKKDFWRADDEASQLDLGVMPPNGSMSSGSPEQVAEKAVGKY